MSQKYLCHRCCKLLDIESNEIAVNEVGRKDCYGCGDNSDPRLHVADKNDLDPIINAFNSRQRAR